MKVVIERGEVPSYLTKGKEYDIIKCRASSRFYGSIIDDHGD